MKKKIDVTEATPVEKAALRQITTLMANNNQILYVPKNPINAAVLYCSIQNIRVIEIC